MLGKHILWSWALCLAVQPWYCGNFDFELSGVNVHGSVQDAFVFLCAALLSLLPFLMMVCWIWWKIWEMFDEITFKHICLLQYVMQTCILCCISPCMCFFVPLPPAELLVWSADLHNRKVCLIILSMLWPIPFWLLKGHLMRILGRNVPNVVD